MVISLLDPLFAPLLSLDPGVSITLISLIVSLIVTLIYKYTTDQKLIKSIKKDMKEKQKALREVKDPKKAMEANKEVMNMNMKIMGQTMKSMIFTLIPVFLILGWLSAHYVFIPLQPQEPFSITITPWENVTLEPVDGVRVLESRSLDQGEVTGTVITMDALAGSYLLRLEREGSNVPYPYKIIVTETYGYYEPAEKTFDDGTIVRADLKTLKPFGNFSIFGWKPGWLGAYILTSIIFSIVTRKLLKVE